MDLTANFDYCVQTGIATVKEIFHLAFKSEDLFPHNVGPIPLSLSGRAVNVSVKVLDDEDRPADLSFEDETHIRFSIPFDISVTVPDAPDPSLSAITLRARTGILARLDTWADGGTDVLGLNFDEATPASVTVAELSGVPVVGITNIEAALHSKYGQVPHVYTQGANELLVYDGGLDATLFPAYSGSGSAAITAALDESTATKYVRIRLPIHVSIPVPGFNFTYTSFGNFVFFRELVQNDTTITVNMANEPAPVAFQTVVNLDAPPPSPLITSTLKSQAIAAIALFGTITEPAFSNAAAEKLLAEQVAAYIKERKFPVYTPQSPDPEFPVATPKGYLLVAPGVLAILMNRQGDTSGDHPPDNFLGANELAMAVGRIKVNSIIADVVKEQFSGLAGGGHPISTPQGEGTLTKLTFELADPGEHGQGTGHVWLTGEAEVHIDCWPDPTVSFEGPVFIDTTLERTDDSCQLTAKGRAGEFDIDQSCCDVLLDLLIPIVGWIMLAVTESMIDSVGGALIDDIAAGQSKILAPIPPVVNGVAQVSACLTGLNIRRDGFIFPGEVSVRRLTTSFEDLEAARQEPRP